MGIQDLQANFVSKNICDQSSNNLAHAHKVIYLLWQALDNIAQKEALRDLHGNSSYISI
jgi:hypothetical protein